VGHNLLSGLLSAWTVAPGAGATATLVLTSTAAETFADDARSLKFTTGGSSANNSSVHQTIDLGSSEVYAEGRSFTFSVYLNQLTGSSAASIQLEFFNGSGTCLLYTSDAADDM
jgi:hypothetical protein